MSKPIPLDFQGAFLDHNGNFVDHIVHHGEEYGDKSQIAQTLFSLFRKDKTVDTHYPVNMSSMWYPEYAREEIDSFYKDQGVDVIIRGKTRIDLVPGEEGGKVYNYTISFPFRYIIYNYCHMYGDVTKSDREHFQEMTKGELKAILQQITAKADDIYINHDVFTVINGHAVNIGS